MFLKFIYIIIIHILIKTIFETEAARNPPFSIEIYSTTCNYYTNLTKRLECGSIKVSDGHFQTSISFMIKETLDVDLTDFRVMIRVQPYKTKTALTFVDVRLNLCFILSQGFNNPMLYDLYLEMRRSSNFPMTCPIKKDILYRVDNFTLTNKYFPVYSPFLNATFLIDIWQKDLKLGDFKIEGALIPKV